MNVPAKSFEVPKNQTHLIIDRNAAIAQLEVLGYTAEDRIYFRFFFHKDDPRKKQDKGRKLDARLGFVPWARLEQFQKEGRGVYFVVNGQGDEDAAIQSCCAVFTEHDDLPKEESRVLWRALGLPEPTLQVDTGGKSIHTYWVLSEPCTVEQWRELQVDLLEFTNGDRQLKNPNRVMRLAGGFHIEPGREPVQSTIVSNSSKRYSFEELRSIIPSSPLEPEPGSERQILWHEFDRDFRLPIPDAVPLYECLSREHRDLVDRGTVEGGRNGSGYALACDLLGVAQHLSIIRQSYQGNPRDLFNQFASNCTPPLPGSEADSIWKSAEKRTTGPAIAPDQIEGCIKGWQWRQINESHPLPLPAEQVPPEQGSNIVEQPTASRRLSSAELQVRIGELLKQNLNQSELDAIIPELARQAERQSKDVWALYRSRLQEQEQEDSKQDRASDLDKLLKISKYRLSLHDYLDDRLAKPLEAIAGYMGTSSAAMLYTLLPVIASLCEVGTRLELVPATNFYALPILYTGLVAESGSGKSPVQKTILEPLFKLQREADENYDKSLAEYERELTQWQREKEGDKPVKPNPTEYYTVDVTREAIAMIQSQQPNKGFLGWVDELSAIVNGRNQ